MKKRTLALILSSLMALTTLTGCGSNGDGKDTDSGAVENKVLKVAAFQGGYGKAYWEKVKEGFEKQHEGVTVELTVESNIEEVLRPQISKQGMFRILYT